MKTLFIDSSRKSLSLALAKDDELLLVSNVNSYSKHSNYLMNEIKNILEKNNIKVYEIDNFVVLNGPGSFTGIRVGVTISKTLAWCLSKKLYQLSNLEALTIGVDDEIIISVIPDKEDYSYVGYYESDIKKEDYLYINDDIFNLNNKNITIITMEENNFSKQLVDKLRINNNVKYKVIDDYNYIKVINKALLNPNINPHLAEPIYLKKIDAEKKKNVN